MKSLHTTQENKQFAHQNPEKDKNDNYMQQKHGLLQCSFWCLDFVKEFPLFGRNISAKIGESRLKICQNSSKNRLNLSSNRLNGGSSFHT